MKIIPLCSDYNIDDYEWWLWPEAFGLLFLEALSQTNIIIKLESAVGYDEDTLSKKIIYELNTRIKVLEKDLAEKEDRISAPEQQVQFLTCKNDEHEQYSRRNILPISSLPESESSSKETVVKLCNEMLDVPITIMDIDRSHRIGPAPSSQPWAAGNKGTATAPANPAPADEVPSVTSTADGDEVEPAHDPNNASRAEGNIAELDHAPSVQQPPGRPIMVKFASYRARDLVFRAKSKLKTHNSQNPSQKIFINEDLTKFRANLCFEARKLKPHILCDVWTHDGRVLVKDPRNNVKLIRNPHDLQQFQ